MMDVNRFFYTSAAPAAAGRARKAGAIGTASGLKSAWLRREWRSLAWSRGPPWGRAPRCSLLGLERRNRIVERARPIAVGRAHASHVAEPTAVVADNLDAASAVCVEEVQSLELALESALAHRADFLQSGDL